jgi:hypothetical protein
MEIELVKQYQGPVLAAKGDVSLGTSGGYTGVTVGTGDDSQVSVGRNFDLGTNGAGYTCNF